MATAPTLPAPTYKSVSEESLITMDDGVQLAATIVRLSKDGKTAAAGRFPAVLSMTPYGRNGVCGCIAPSFFATRGIVGAVVDVRGTGGSGGNLKDNFFSPREARDGYNLVEYLGTRTYTTGKVGMAGGSYVGITQYLTAERRPPHLAVIVPQVAISDLYRDGFAHGGIQNLSFDLQYIAVQGAPGYVGPNTSPTLLQQTVQAKLGQSLPGSIAFDYLSRPNDDKFYRDRSPIYDAAKIAVPVLDIGGWRDGLLRGETEMYTALSKRKGVETRLYMDPCTHKGCGAPFAPLTNPPGQHDLAAIIFEFLSKYLQGTKTPRRSPVEFFVQSANTYVSATTWPPTGVRYEALKLTRGLALSATADGTGTASYISNPTAGLSTALDRYGTVAASPYVPTDQRLEEEQGVTLRTKPLTRPLRLAGPLALHLVASSTATDTDWYAKVADVAADGSESIITTGALRASHRAVDKSKSSPARPYHPHTNPTPIKPGAYYDYDLEIWPTAYELAPGHQLQLRITSSDLPTHFPGSSYLDKGNPTATRVSLMSPATNTIRLDASYLLLPVSG